MGFQDKRYDCSTQCCLGLEHGRRLGSRQRWYCSTMERYDVEFRAERDQPEFDWNLG